MKRVKQIYSVTGPIAFCNDQIITRTQKAGDNCGTSSTSRMNWRNQEWGTQNGQKQTSARVNVATNA